MLNPLVVCVLFVALLMLAQDTSPVREPEFIGAFYALDASSGNLLDLERQTPRFQLHTKMMGYRGGKESAVVPGPRSPVRFKSGSPIAFIVKLETGGQDPTTLISIHSMKSRKNEREVEMVSVGALGHSSKSTLDDSAVPINVAKYGQASYKVTSSQTLAPGEYVIASSPRVGYFFGID